jgi:hypothetical protein
VAAADPKSWLISRDFALPSSAHDGFLVESEPLARIIRRALQS